MGPLSEKIRQAVERLASSASFRPNQKERRVFPPPPAVPVLETDYRTALRGVMDPRFCLSIRYDEQQLRANRVGADPRILEFERVFVRYFRAMNVPMWAHTVVRSWDDQNAAYVRGVSKAKAGESAHNYGLAVDLVHGTKGWDLSKRQWDIVGHCGKEIAAKKGIKLVWGGDWKFWDPAHWELTHWRDPAKAGS